MAFVILISISFTSAQSNFLSTGGFLFANDSNLSDPNGKAAVDENELELFAASRMLSTSSSTMIPVELNHFEVEVISKQEVMVRWMTSLEIENDFFEIEKSEDGVNWYAIGEMNGKGTNFEHATYMFIDKHPKLGRSFYRIKQVNFDQDYAFSNAAYVNIHTDDFQIFPNPTRDKIFLFVGHYSKDLKFEIRDIIGNIHFKGDLTSIETEINVSNLIQGTYLLQIVSEDGHYRKPMVFVKTK
ncbi:T9SS type A sorting domain-containing protein [Portibacter lacus]|uniref:T9SS type A sorting domain-containing protein n=1 Tax=Portibacter lacus TaxID=1099794 RepID=UPI001F2EA913|nr:T9SS type A sorting domain-containing protein [Portibacter lacus]